MTFPLLVPPPIWQLTDSSLQLSASMIKAEHHWAGRVPHLCRLGLRQCQHTIASPSTSCQLQSCAITAPGLTDFQGRSRPVASPPAVRCNFAPHIAHLTDIHSSHLFISIKTGIAELQQFGAQYTTQPLVHHALRRRVRPDSLRSRKGNIP